jgi:hypothetical protein
VISLFKVLGSPGRAAGEIAVIGQTDGTYRAKFDLQDHSVETSVYDAAWAMDVNLRNERWTSIERNLDEGRLKFRSPVDGYPERVVDVSVIESGTTATMHVTVTVAAR